MYKTSSRYYHSNELYRDMKDSDGVVFFGHSINGMDYVYFKDFFKTQSTEEAEQYQRKWIRIFTYNTESMQTIKYRLRENGIDLVELYRLNDLDFIQTKELEAGDSLETKKFNQFVQDITAKVRYDF